MASAWQAASSCFPHGSLLLDSHLISSRHSVSPVARRPEPAPHDRPLSRSLAVARSSFLHLASCLALCMLCRLSALRTAAHLVELGAHCSHSLCRGRNPSKPIEWRVEPEVEARKRGRTGRARKTGMSTCRRGSCIPFDVESLASARSQPALDVLLAAADHIAVLIVRHRSSTHSTAPIGVVLWSRAQVRMWPPPPSQTWAPPPKVGLHTVPRED